MPKPYTRRPASSTPVTYESAGVSIEAGDSLVDFLRASNPAIGGFAGLAAIPARYRKPRLVMSTDGVGTKLLVAQLAGAHRTIGFDLVGMVVNDIAVCGAKPLWFLDYFATGRLEGGVAREVLAGILDACRACGCALVGGETAEMPGMYAPGHYDLAGFGVGVVEADRAIDGHGVKPGDVVIGLESDGLHSNGYSLARRALLPAGEAAARKALARPFEGGTLADALLRPTRLYSPAVERVLARHEVRAMAHITGGGIAGNLVRTLPPGVRATIRPDWTVPPIFDEIARRGPVERGEMFKVFNMGIGFMMVVPPDAADAVVRAAKRAGERPRVVGEIARGASRKAPADVVVEGFAAGG